MESSTRKVNVVNLIIKLVIFTFEQYTCMLVMFYNMYTYKHIYMFPFIPPRMMV